MDLAPDCSVTEASALQQLLERWAAYDNRCLNHRIVARLPWKQMSKTISLPCPNFSLSVTCLLFRILFSFLIFFPVPVWFLHHSDREMFFLFFSLKCLLMSPSSFLLFYSCTYSSNCSSCWHFARGRLAHPHLLCHWESSVSQLVYVCVVNSLALVRFTLRMCCYCLAFHIIYQDTLRR